MKSTTFIFLLLCSIIAHSQTATLGVQQTLNKFIPASPQASAIATYETCPVDYMTGIPVVGKYQCHVFGK